MAVMEYGSPDRVPNHEVGVWGQTIDRWCAEGLDVSGLYWDWFTGEEHFGMDLREYIPVSYSMRPPFDQEILEETDRYLVRRNAKGIVTRALKEGTVRGTRASMDEYISFPVREPRDFLDIKRRFAPADCSRYPPYWRETRLRGWQQRDHVLVLGRNCSTLGFYWWAREWMGTENLSYAWYDQPDLLHEMMEFIADFTIEISRPILEEVEVEYVFVNEDMAMKSGPLLSPDTYRTFIYPRMRRLVDYFKSHNVRYVMVDTDGNPEALIPLLMEAGVDGIWPLERAADVDPLAIRKRFGRDLRLWGGVDKRVLTRSPRDIDRHLQSLAPLVEQGGFIPTVDHLVPPDVPLANFVHYMDQKKRLLEGRL